MKIIRYHDISAGHRVLGHENKCGHAHGHNFRIHFTCTAEKLDNIGRIIDFGVIKEKLCNWLEDNWDHKFLLWEDDPWLPLFSGFDPKGTLSVPFNPTSENMAWYLLHNVCPLRLKDTGVIVTKVRVDETRKCSAYAKLKSDSRPVFLKNLAEVRKGASY